MSKRRRLRNRAAGDPTPGSTRRTVSSRWKPWWHRIPLRLVAGALLGTASAVLLVLAWEVMPLPPGMRSVSGTPRPAARVDAVGRLLLPLNYNLSLVNFPSRALRTIVSAGDRGVITGARWSPDGRQAAYTHFRPRGKEPVGSDIAVVQISDDAVSDPTTVLERDRAGASFDSPIWSPDQRSLYVSYSAIDGNQPVERIEKVDLQSGARIPVTNGRLPEFSPDGTRLVFVRAEPAGDALWSAAADGTNARVLLTPDASTVIGPTRFSPDGKMLAVALSRPADLALAPSPPRPFALLGTGIVLAHGSPWEIYLIDAAGGPVVRLTKLQEDEIGIAWSPDGELLAVYGLRGVHLVDRQGRTTFALDQGGFGSIDWAP